MDLVHALDTVDWPRLAAPIAAAEDALARLDERLAKSAIREGWIARSHFIDAGASLWLDGGLVHLEDLVLHDAGMDVRAPSHDLTRAHAALRARRRIAAAETAFAVTAVGLDALRGKSGEGRAQSDGPTAESDSAEYPSVSEEADPGAGGASESQTSDSGWNAEMAEIDAILARAGRASPPASRRPPERDPLVYDLDWNEDARVGAWLALVAETATLPPVLAAALVGDAWEVIAPLAHQPWLGRLAVAGLLRARGKTRAHLACLNTGLRKIPRERRRSARPSTRHAAWLDAIAAAANAGLADHDRWLLARTQLLRKLAGRRSTSRLPALIDFVMARPIVSAGMIAGELGVTPRAAQDLVAELGLRETTGRRRYRAWGVI